MKLSEQYFEARSEAMKWLALPPEKRNFAVGLQIFGKSGYKPTVHGLLVRKGEVSWTVEKLTSCLREVVQVYYNPDDPRFNDNPDVDVLNDSEGSHASVEEQQALAKSVDTEAYNKMPEVMQLVIKAFADAYKQRAKLARKRQEITEDNSPEAVASRKEIGDSMDQLTSYMDALAPLKEAYDRHGTVPDKEAFLAIAKQADKTPSEDTKVDNAAEIDYKQFDSAALKTRRKSLTNQITRKENQLLYQSDSKKEVENPMPDSPKRVKLLAQVEKLKAERSKVEYELAERGL